MLKLEVNPIVLQSLAVAFPTPPKSAQKALDKYIEKLEGLLSDALMIGQTEYERKLNFYSILVNELRRSCRIGSQKKWLHDWLIQNNLALIKIVDVGSNLNGLKSVVSLTKLVKIEEQFSFTKLVKTQGKSSQQNQVEDLTEARELFNKLYPNIFDFQNDEEELTRQYDFVVVNTESVKSYLDWLVHDAHLISLKNKNEFARHAQIILKICEITKEIFIQKKIHSEFGRTYYEGVSIQSVNKELRRAILGDSYEYDIKSSVISWKMGFARECHKATKSNKPFEKDFFDTLNYLNDKKDFMLTVRNNTFTNEEKYTKIEQEKILKQAVTAICFGASVRAHGWKDSNGHWQHASINSIIKDTECRKRFVASPTVKHFIEEQKKLDDYIFNKLKKEKPNLTTLKILQSASGRVSKAKLLAYAYQHAETEVMEVVRNELDELKNEILANIHDAIVVRSKLTKIQRERIEQKMRFATVNEYWQLGEKKLEKYNSVNREALNEEKAHKERIALEELRAKGYKSQLKSDDFGTVFSVE